LKPQLNRSTLNRSTLGCTTLNRTMRRNHKPLAHVFVGVMISLLTMAAALAQTGGTRDVIVFSQTFKAINPGGFGTAFVPLSGLASTLGLGTQVGRDWLNLTQGGMLLRFALADTALEAARATRALVVNGRAVNAPAAGFQGGEIYVPLRAVVENLGGSTQDIGGQIVVSFNPVQLTEVSKSNGSNADRAVLELTRNASFTARVEGDEAVVRVRNARADPVRYTVGGRFINEVEIRSLENEVEARIRLPQGAGFRAFAIPAAPGASFGESRGRIAIDVAPTFGRPAVALESQPVVIVLDPGHGGPDRGVQEGALWEKTLALSMARLIAQNLQNRGAEVRLTRNEDINPSLAARRERALTSDVFVSLHASKLNGSSAEGLSIYSLDRNVNRPGTLGAGRVALTETTDETRRRLLETFLSTPDAGEQLADAVLGRIQAIPDPKFPAQVLTTANQVLLSHAPKSAILIELGWLSNQADVQRLSNRANLERLARSIAAGILDYLAPVLSRRGTTATTTVTPASPQRPTPQPAPPSTPGRP
jgi:N-acetylmuramoyl-L-alanine amidase